MFGSCQKWSVGLLGKFLRSLLQHWKNTQHGIENNFQKRDMFYEPQSLMQADINKWRGWRLDRIHINIRNRPTEYSAAVASG